MKNITEVFKKERNHPIRVLQFGQGNFLRAFADDFIDRLNEKCGFDGGVAVVKTTDRGDLSAFERQKGLYTVAYRGKGVCDNRIVSCLQTFVSTHTDPAGFFELAGEPELRFIISNTTEAGIALSENDSFQGMPESYPAKLAKFLFLRYSRQCGEGGGVYVIPTELIEGNAARLYKLVTEISRRWGLEEGFFAWLDQECFFCESLVDRIVSGRPKEPVTDWEDELCDVCEPFGLWVIEEKGNIREEFPLEKAGVNAVFTDDVSLYRERKVRILNGSHTSIAPLGLLLGKTTVKDCMDDPLMRKYLDTLQQRALKPYVPLAPEEVERFIRDVNDRFDNPYLNHALISICLNSSSKFVSRLIPSLKDGAAATGSADGLIAFAFAALIRLYRVSRSDGAYVCRVGGREYRITDKPDTLEFFAGIADLADEDYFTAAAKNAGIWGEDLRLIPGFEKAGLKAFCDICRDPEAALREAVK